MKNNKVKERLDKFAPPINWEPHPDYRREPPKPINVAPYCVAVLVLVAVLIIDGCLTEFGVVDYSPILK